jgi:hypothetical protein
MTSRLAPAAACNRREAPRKLECLRGSYTDPGQGSGAQQHHPRRRVRTRVTPCTRDIKMMDGAITTAIKRAYGLPTSAGTAFTHEDTDKWGMGMPSLAVEYATRNTTLLQSPYRIREDSSHTRTHGEATARPRRRGGTRSRPVARGHRMRVRQHAITRAAGLCIKINDHTQYDDLTTVLETIKGSTRGRKRYAYCATQIHAPPEMGITHLVEVMEPNGARHDRAALRLLGTSRAIQVTALNTLATLLSGGPGRL